MKQTTIQILNGIFWCIVIVALNAGVIYQWSANAAPTKSLVLGCLFFTLLPFGIGLAIHYQIEEANK